MDVFDAMGVGNIEADRDAGDGIDTERGDGIDTER